MERRQRKTNKGGSLEREKKPKEEKPHKIIPAMQTLVEVDGILASDDLVLAALALVHHREFPVKTRRSVCACVSRDGFFFAPCPAPKYPEERDVTPQPFDSDESPHLYRPFIIHLEIIPGNPDAINPSIYAQIHL